MQNRFRAYRLRGESVPDFTFAHRALCAAAILARAAFDIRRRFRTGVTEVDDAATATRSAARRVSFPS
jgi:hypothetical protein